MRIVDRAKTLVQHLTQPQVQPASKKAAEPPPEYRRDLITGTQVIIAPQRGSRPITFVLPSDESEMLAPQRDDPFLDPQASGNKEPVLCLTEQESGEWSLQVFENKYPAVQTDQPVVADVDLGPYESAYAYGYHYVVVTRDPVKNIAHLSHDKVEEIIRAFLQMYRDIQNDPLIRYITVFQNHGRQGGASLPHPHSQILATAIVPDDVRGQMERAKKFYEAHGVTLFDFIIKRELADESRIVYQNQHFLVFCPYAPLFSFEMHIFPKEHESYFEHIKDEHIGYLVDALRATLQVLSKVMLNVHYNFFVRVTPVNSDSRYDYWRWHIVVTPRILHLAGLEIATRLSSLSMTPERMAESLRENTVPGTYSFNERIGE